LLYIKRKTALKWTLFEAVKFCRAGMLTQSWLVSRQPDQVARTWSTRKK
jgi:hypothetical protein